MRENAMDPRTMTINEETSPDGEVPAPTDLDATGDVAAPGTLGVDTLPVPAGEVMSQAEFEARVGKRPTFGFGRALELLDAPRRVARLGWNGKGQYLGLARPDAHSANTLPYIYIATVRGERVPWVASHADMMAQDWFDASE